MESALVQSLRLQSKACAALGSPFHAALLEEAANALPHCEALRQALSPWERADRHALMAAAVPLRLLGALHELVLSGDDLALAAAYPAPGRPADPAAAWTAASRALSDHRARIAAFMEHEPQTNEVRRSAALLGGFLTIAKETGLPLRCFEIAASAGLNLSWTAIAIVSGKPPGDPRARFSCPPIGPGPCLRWTPRCK
jgi:hypothetical protein